MDIRVVIGLIVLAIVVIVLIAAAVIMRRRNSERLRTRFGPEYERSVREKGSAVRAEAELKQRMERVSRMAIRPLPESARQRYWERWLGVQRAFVDDPRFAVAAADDLITDVMAARGYPIKTFEQLAADVSVDHAQVVSDYRAAHEIAQHNRTGEVSTEELRKAITYYRSLFEELLETRAPARKEVA